VATYDAQIRIKVANLNQLKKLEDRVNRVQNALQGKSPTGKQAKANIAATSPELQKEKKITKELKTQLRIRQQMKRTPGVAGGTSRGGKGGVLSGALISGAFPLLFGQGPLGGLAGFTGGLIGGKVGGQMGGFAGGLIATAGLTQIQQAIQGINELGAALKPESLNLDKLITSLGLTGTEESKRLKLIEQLEGKQAALNEATREMNRVIGEDGVAKIKEFTEVTRTMGNNFARTMTRMMSGLTSAIMDSPLGKFLKTRSEKGKINATLPSDIETTDPVLKRLISEQKKLSLSTPKDINKQALGPLTLSSGGLFPGQINNTAEQQIADANSAKSLDMQLKSIEKAIEARKKVLLIAEEQNIKDANAKKNSELILRDIKEQNQFLQESLSLGTFQAEVERKVRDLKLEQKAIGKDLSAADEKAFRDQLKINDELKKQKALQEDIQNILAGGMTNAVMGLIEGSKTLGQVLADVAKQLASMFLNRAFMSIFSNMSFGGGGGGIGGGALPPAPIYVAAQGGFSRSGGFKAFQQGGVVNSPIMGMVGEGGESEYIIPASKMSGAMARYSAGARGGSVIPGGSGDSGTVAGSSGNTVVEYTGPTLNFNGDEYVPKSAVPDIIGAATKQGAMAGKAQTINTLRNSRSQRASLGL